MFEDEIKKRMQRVQAQAGHGNGCPFYSLSEISQVISAATDSEAKATEELEKLALKLNDLSARYDAVVLTKSKLEKNFAQVEEQNLVYKKALLSSQIDNGKLADQSDQQNFDLNNKVMNLQKECMESGEKIDSLLQENANMKTDLTQLKHERNSLSIELDSLGSNYYQLEKEHKSVLRKIDELGVEIVNLVNTKETLLSEKDDKSREFQKIQKQYVLCLQ